MKPKVILFYVDWAYHRPGPDKYSLDDVGQCTSLIYSFVSMKPDTFEITPCDPQSFEAQHEEFIKLCKETNKLPVLALGGWVDSAGDKYSRMLTDSHNRALFIKNTVEYLKKFGFKGINIDIEYPSAPQANFADGDPKDRDGFSKLVEEMRRAFDEQGFELSTCLPGNPSFVDKCYDVKVLNQYLDWIGVMSYDYHVSSNPVTGPISSIADTKTTLNHLIKSGAEPEKLIVGIPFYGHRFILKDKNIVKYGAESLGSGPPGKCTNESGFLAYYEICDLIKNKGYNAEEHELGAFAYKDQDFISYNSKHDIKQKINLVKEYNLGGLLIWESSMDDFTGTFCLEGKNPLLAMINEQIKEI